MKYKVGQSFIRNKTGETVKIVVVGLEHLSFSDNTHVTLHELITNYTYIKPKKKKNKLEKRVKKLEKIVKKLQANQEEDEQVISGILAGVAFGEPETPNKKVINPK